MDNFSKNERTETTDVVICNSDYSSKTFEPCRVHTDGQVYFRLRCKVRTKFFSTSRKPRLTYPKVAVYRLGCWIVEQTGRIIQHVLFFFSKIREEEYNFFAYRICRIWGRENQDTRLMIFFLIIILILSFQIHEI